MGDSGMLIDADENVKQVDENEKARTIGQDDQAMDMVGDKSDDVGVGVGRMMQVDGMLFFLYSLVFYFVSHECRRRSHYSKCRG